MSEVGVSQVEEQQAPHILAFYLPQYHHVPENDAWHGGGFTEWSVVAKSHPLYPGHRQPDLPGELGFYDLRVPETRYLQARLAREHGITGFLYYHYWFAGRRMLGRPFQEVLESGKPDFPFALCWANESWYRRWQGSLDEMILEQTFSEEDDVAHIRWLIEAFKDHRYIRIEGRPLLAIYRPHFLPNSKRTVELWHRECENAGVEPPWLIGFETGDAFTDPGQFGFDASAQFVPHHLPHLIGSKPFRFGAEKSHRMYEYDDVASAYLNRPDASWRRYPCVATAWDNSPRRQTGEALILHNSTPEGYGRWLSEAATRQSHSAGSQGIVFINAWNEWAEGAHLEPDAFWGRAYLEVTRDVLQGAFGELKGKPGAAELAHPPPIATEDLYHDLYEKFVALQQTSSEYLSYFDRRMRELKNHYEARLGWARHQATHVIEMNEWLAEQLQLQADRMRELALPDVPSTDWLSPRPYEPDPVGRGNADSPESRAPGGDGQEDVGELTVCRAGDEDDGEAPVVLTEEEERRRDEGYNEPPGMPISQWLIEVDASD